MEDPYDSYPEDSDRRRFVKGVVGAGALSGVIAAGTSMVDISTTPGGAGGGPANYMGIELVGGPAPRGMPMIPLEYDEEDYLRGIWPEVEMREVGGQQVPVAETEIGGQTYNSNWYQYCGSQNNPAVQPDAERDNFFRYRENPPYDWQSNEVTAGDRVHAADFTDFDEWGNNIGSEGIGKPATVTWRSTDLEPRDRLPVQLIRSPLIQQKAEEAADDSWLSAATEDGFIAIHNQCTHFCCVPGYKQLAESAAYNAADEIYCNCHQSIYDPFTVVEQSMVALPRPD